MYTSQHTLIVIILLMLILIYFKRLLTDTKLCFTKQLLYIFCLIYHPSKRKKSDSDLEKLFSHLLKSPYLHLPKIVLQTFPIFNLIDQRIRSFRRLSNQNFSIPFRILAEAGFYYRMEDHTVECFSCGRIHQVEDFLAHTTPSSSEFHNSGCVITRTASNGEIVLATNNATPDFLASLASRTINIAYIRRLMTFRNMKRIADPRFDAHVLAYSGYRLLNIHEISQVASRHTDSELPSPDRTATQITQQAENNPDFLPHHPEIADLTHPVERFSDGQPTARQLADIGFFYSSTNDRVRCYFCGGDLYVFRSLVSVMEEHARWDPRCPLGHLLMSMERINSRQQSASNSASNSTALNPSLSSSLVPSFFEPSQQAAVAASVALAQLTTDQKEATVSVSNTSQITNQSRDPTSPALDVMIGDPIHKEYILTSKRLESFLAWPRKHLLRDPDLAEGGFNSADASNSTALSHTSVSLTPAEHRPSIPLSTHSQQASRDRPANTPTSTNVQHASRDRPTPTYNELGILTERPKRADYALKVKRHESFARWPRGHHLSVENIVDAGFYYGGYGDCARCFYCGGGLRNWEDEDDVWVEHARWFPKCGYLRQTLGQAFIDTVQDLRDRDQISLKLVADCMGVAESDLCVVSKENLTRDAAVRAVVDLGYPLADVLQAAELVKQEANILSADNIIEKLEQEGKRRLYITRNREPVVDPSNVLENIRAMKEQNNQLRQQTICKICMDKEVSVVFLPCGHLVSCGECAVAMRDCPVCRVNVKGIVKASMG